jgi:hypothetical protein
MKSISAGSLVALIAFIGSAFSPVAVDGPRDAWDVVGNSRRAK